MPARAFETAVETKASVATLVEVSPALWVVAVVPLGSTTVLGSESVHDPDVVIGLAPVTVIWLAVPASPTLVTVPLPNEPQENPAVVDQFNPVVQVEPNAANVGNLTLYQFGPAVSE